MASYRLVDQGWRDGYLTLSIIQFTLVVALFATLPLWTEMAQDEALGSEVQDKAPISNREALGIPRVKAQLFLYFCYCSLKAERAFGPQVTTAEN